MTCLWCQNLVGRGLNMKKDIIPWTFYTHRQKKLRIFIKTTHFWYWNIHTTFRFECMWEVFILRYSALLDFHRVLHKGNFIRDNKVVTNSIEFTWFCKGLMTNLANNKITRRLIPTCLPFMKCLKLRVERIFEIIIFCFRLFPFVYFEVNKNARSWTRCLEPETEMTHRYTCQTLKRISKRTKKEVKQKTKKLRL